MMTRQAHKLKEFEGVLQKVFGSGDAADIKDKFTNFIQSTGNTTIDYFAELKERISKADPNKVKNNYVKKPKRFESSKTRASSKKKRNNKNLKPNEVKRVKNELIWLPDIKFVREPQKDEFIEVNNLPKTFWIDLSLLPELTEEDFTITA